MTLARWASILAFAALSAPAHAQEAADAGAAVAAPGPPPAPDAGAMAVAIDPDAGTDAAAPEGPPPPPAPIPRPTRERSATMAATGGLMVGFGLIGLITGAGLVALGLVEQEIGTCQDGVYGYRYHCGIGQTGEDFVTGGLVTMAVGGGLIFLGFPPLIFGSKHVPKDSAATPRLSVGMRSAGVKVPF